ncbi:DUF4145 domain-containing protein [Paenibacillus glucanolyticus]|uniref:DUF4145 domain-containing protein n=1 Tax=Paenibacillus glucanolyticus TaxID=59843 RepID=UPI00096CE84A|nr:DUF4145 domain-containing protein [Paenibacillus glucanolyticus]OMF76645.1 hypothetical protein BK142_14050 [Paenibacillus glucanolyticus]
MNFCNQCNRETNYTVLETYKEQYFDEYRCESQWHIIKCGGCNTVSFRSEFHDIESGYPVRDPYSGQEEWEVPITVETFPKAQKFRLIEGSEHIPDAIYKAYKQTLSAYKEEATILVGIGCRAIIEAICTDQSANEGNLEQSIDKMSSKGVLSKQDANLLHSIRFLGNDAAHEIKEPSLEQLNVTLKIVEHLLYSLYILPKNAEKIMDTIIDSYGEFEYLVSVCTRKSNPGQELPLKDILGKKVMRRIMRNLEKFQTELNRRIAEGTYTKLAFGKTEEGRKGQKFQYYIISH